jgi:hypothetical protein
MLMPRVGYVLNCSKRKFIIEWWSNVKIEVVLVPGTVF